MRQVVISDTMERVAGMAKKKPRRADRLVDPAAIGWRLQCFREALKIDSHGKFIHGTGLVRQTYVGWETGSSRLSLDGALALVKKHKCLSLDYLYLGRTGAIPNLPLQNEVALLLARKDL